MDSTAVKSTELATEVPAHLLATQAGTLENSPLGKHVMVSLPFLWFLFLQQAHNAVR
jgi:hypothetical protein